MARNVVFLIHGVGQHGESWASEPGGPIETLKASAARYARFNGVDLEDLIEFVPIRYDDIFDRILDQWASLAEGLGAAGELLPGSLAKAVDFMETCGDDTDKFLTFGGDVILYRGFKLFRQRLLLRVIRTIVDKVAELWTDDLAGIPRFSIVAHSLGTTVAHDAIHHLGTESWLVPYEFDDDGEEAEEEAESAAASGEAAQARKQQEEPFAPGNFEFETIFMLANTSGLLSTVPGGPTASIVRPNFPEGVKGYTRRFYNVAHVLDPIAAVRPFAVPASWKSAGESAIDIRLNHLHERNVHGFGHYLLHPDVHIRLLYYSLENWDLDASDLRAPEDFPRIGGAMAAQAAALEAKLAALVASSPAVTEIKAFAELLLKLKTLVGGL